MTRRLRKGHCSLERRATEGASTLTTTLTTKAVDSKPLRLACHLLLFVLGFRKLGIDSSNRVSTYHEPGTKEGKEARPVWFYLLCPEV